MNVSYIEGMRRCPVQTSAERRDGLYVECYKLHFAGHLKAPIKGGVGDLFQNLFIFILVESPFMIALTKLNGLNIYSPKRLLGTPVQFLINAV